MIKISVVSYNNEASKLALSGVFGQQGGTLGRGDDNFFVLPDPKRFVSRKQASVRSDGVRHTITNLSQANPILINGQEIDFGREHDLQAGDKIQIGLYVLCAQPYPVSASDHSVCSAEVGDGCVAVMALHPHEDNVPVTPSTGLTGPAYAAAKLPAAPHAHVPAAGTIELAPAAEKLRASEQQKSSVARATDQAPETRADAVDSQVLVDAFLSGAGISDITLASGLTPELMEMIGKLLATTIQGTFELVASRASIKREVQADVTMVVVRNNNPLKFLPDGQTVLIQMLRKKMPGFMAPVETMQDAYEDLHAHWSGMNAGMRATANEMLERFDPQQFEDLQERSVLDAALPMRRKARMWDNYAALFEAIQQEAQNDLQNPFGKAFLNAYEEEIGRFKNRALDD